jgi:integrase
MQPHRIPRRVSVNGRPGIYYRIGADGKRRYEITFLDERGDRRWLTVNGKLATAQAALDERRRRRRAGETVVVENVRLAAFANAWLDSQTQLRPSTKALYRIQLDSHVLPKLGRLCVSEICEDDVLALIAEMRDGWYYRKDDEGRFVRTQRTQGYSAYTIKGALVPLGRILNAAVRRRQIPSNPMARLERGERPSLERRDVRVLSSDEIRILLGSADGRQKPLLATALFTGLRLGELLGLTWADIDLEENVVRVRKQLDRTARRAPLKTSRAARDVELMPALSRLLEKHKNNALKAGRADPESFVFTSRTGTPLQHRNVPRRVLDPAMDQAKLTGAGRPRLRFHDLRHTFAGLLIAQGHDIVFIGRQLGHSSTQVTLDVYGHILDKARLGQRMRDELEAAFGDIVEPVASTHDCGRRRRELEG